MNALCCVCGAEEGRDRCCWPMPDSPASFGAWDDALDREILAERLPCDEFDAPLLAEHLRIAQVSIWTYVARGKIPAPDHYEESRAIWKAEQLVGAL